jgi:hypothetical protein
MRVTALGTPDDVTTDVGTVTAVEPAGDDMLRITIDNLPFVGQVNLSFPGVTSAALPDPATGSDSTLCVSICVGDYDNLGRTNFTNLAKIKTAGYINQLVDSVDKARADFDCDGRPTFTDFAKVKNANLINAGVAPCDPAIGP